MYIIYATLFCSALELISRQLCGATRVDLLIIYALFKFVYVCVSCHIYSCQLLPYIIGGSSLEILSPPLFIHLIKILAMSGSQLTEYMLVSLLFFGNVNVFYIYGLFKNFYLSVQTQIGA